MRVGLYLRNYKLTEGGAALLIQTLRKELTHLDTDKYEFVTIYNGGICDAYKKVIDKSEYINLTRARLRYIIPAKISDTRNIPRKILFRLLCRIDNGKTSSYWDILCKKERIDILWFTHPVQERVSIPYIFTIWDLGHRILPAFPEMTGGISDWNERENVYQEMIYRATRVITANEAGKREILENYPIPEDKIRIVPFPLSSMCDLDERKPSSTLPEEYFLYPAQFWPHKNHIRVIQALRVLRDERDTIVNVIFTGSDNETCRYIKRITDQYGLTDQVVFAGLVESDELKYLYTHSCGLIYASLFGPNNIPPDEAVYLRKPVIISSIEGHREQMGDAALYFDPYDARDLAEKVLVLLKDSDVTDRLMVAANKRRDELVSYDYAGTMMKIIDELYEMRICWS